MSYTTIVERKWEFRVKLWTPIGNSDKSNAAQKNFCMITYSLLVHYKIEILINIIIAISVLFIVVQYLFSLTSVQLSIVYVFDFMVVIILAVDFSNREIKTGAKICIKALV